MDQFKITLKTESEHFEKIEKQLAVFPKENGRENTAHVINISPSTTVIEPPTFDFDRVDNVVIV